MLKLQFAVIHMKDFFKYGMFTYKEAVSGIRVLYIVDAVPSSVQCQTLYLWIFVLDYFIYLSYWFLKANQYTNNHNK